MVENKNIPNKEILVSIVCTAYNHENYIKDALEGFLMQEANFNFEILIHDDASTDNTAKIVKKYEKKYPNLIKGIYQKENQYSKGIKVSEILYKKAKGKYIAICEGDDYWSDKYKLQKQIDYMEKHPRCTFCFTNAIAQILNENREEIFLKKNKLNIKVFEFEKFDVGELAILGFIPTASFVFPKRILNSMPNFYSIPFKAGDFKLRLACTYQGYAHFINEPMVVYRIGVPNSVTTIWAKENKEKEIERWEKFIMLIKCIDNETNGNYHKNLNKLKIEYIKLILSLIRDKKLLKNKKHLKYFENISLKDKIILNLYLKHSTIYKFLKKIKDLI